MQPNVDSWEKLKAGSRPVVLRKTVALTNRALAKSETKPDLLIMPETAVPYDLTENKDARETIYRGVARWQTPLLTGLLDAPVADDAAASWQAPGDKPRAREIFNSAAILSPAPEEQGKRLNVSVSPVYHKRVLVPFVERVPYVEQSFPRCSVWQLT